MDCANRIRPLFWTAPFLWLMLGCESPASLRLAIQRAAQRTNRVVEAQSAERYATRPEAKTQTSPDKRSAKAVAAEKEAGTFAKRVRASQAKSPKTASATTRPAAVRDSGLLLHRSQLASADRPAAPTTASTLKPSNKTPAAEKPAGRTADPAAPPPADDKPLGPVRVKIVGVAAVRPTTGRRWLP